MTRLAAILDAWNKQGDHERILRSRIVDWVFGLISLQLVGMFGLLVAAGANWLSVSADVLKIIVPSICGEIVGMGFVVVKYLFNVPLRRTLDDLIKGSDRPEPR